MMSRLLFLLMMSWMLAACGTTELSDYQSFARSFGNANPPQANIDGWYQIPLRLPRNADIERPFVAQAMPDRLTAQLLLYPAVDMAGDYPSRVENASGYFLDIEMMEWFFLHYVAVDSGVDPGAGCGVDARSRPRHGA